MGQLIVVGTGLQPSRHVSQRVLSEIRRADVVFVLANPFAIEWLRSLHPDVRNLSRFYADDRDRRESYHDMEQALLAQVRTGSSVCAVFYGHPGVFAQVPHNAIRQARSEGYPASMEPGISAEACLYADLGLDPGHRGLQSFEATQFLVYRHTVDTTCLVLLWQVALAGNLDCIGFEPRTGRLQVLVDKLTHWYAPTTEVILYEAPTLPIADFRAERLTLADLPFAHYEEYTTLVIPPAKELERDAAYWRVLSGL